MSVEERVRSAARERADLVRDIRPLDLPGAPTRLPRWPRTRRWVTWAAPVAAAAVVVALAVGLVSLRQARSEPAVPGAAQSGAAASSAAAVIPGYYAALDYPNRPGPIALGVGKTGAASLLSTMSAPRGQSFAGVTGAADDRTFVAVTEAYPVHKNVYSGAPVTWYLLRVSTADGSSVKISKLSIPGQPKGTQVSGIALAPDGSELAVLFQRGVWSGKLGPLTLSVYSVSTGKVLRTWTQQANGPLVGYGWYSGQYSNTSITWLSGQRLAFDEGVYSGPGNYVLDPVFTDVKIRMLSLSRPGGSLLADSKVIVALANSSCGTLQLTADGKSVFCGTSAGRADRKSSAYDPRIVEYAVATGKSRLVYRRAGVYNYGVANVLWLSASGSSLVGAVDDLTKDAAGGVGYVDAGPIVKGVLKPIVFPVGGPPFAGGIAF